MMKIVVLLSLFIVIFAFEKRPVRIVGGFTAKSGQFPYIAAIINSSLATNAKSGQLCGGSLVSPSWILTAAHCVEELDPSEVVIKLGIIELSNIDGRTILAKSFYTHPTIDAALIELETPFEDGSIIHLADIDDVHFEKESQKATVVGWGSISEDGYDFPNELYWVEMPIVSYSQCKTIFPSLEKEYICAGISGKDSCYGDSGGPLLVKGKNGDLQIGIVSYGPDVCDGNYGVYSKVSSIRSWVETYTGDLGDFVLTPSSSSQFHIGFGGALFISFIIFVSTSL